MKKSNYFTAILLAAIWSLPLHAKEGQVTVHVVDESGNPIPNIEVGADFNNSMAPGSGGGLEHQLKSKGLPT